MSQSALIYSQKRGAHREMAVQTEVSAPRDLLQRAHCVQGGRHRILWVSWLPGPGIKAYSSVGSGLCLVLLEAVSAPSHTVQASDLGPGGKEVGKSWKGMSRASVGPSRAEWDRVGLLPQLWRPRAVPPPTALASHFLLRGYSHSVVH